MTTVYSIGEHWDTNGEITAESDPQQEYDLWQQHAASNPDEWTGREFTLSDFEEYIAGQKI